VKRYVWNIALYGVETWTLRKVDHKYLESLKCGAGEGWRRSVVTTVWEVLHRVGVERNILKRIKRMKTNWIGHILHGNCLIKHIIEGKIEGGIEVRER
jgi:hypothetical protein